MHQGLQRQEHINKNGAAGVHQGRSTSAGMGQQARPECGLKRPYARMGLQQPSKHLWCGLRRAPGASLRMTHPPCSTASLNSLLHGRLCCCPQAALPDKGTTRPDAKDRGHVRAGGCAVRVRAAAWGRRGVRAIHQASTHPAAG